MKKGGNKMSALPVNLSPVSSRFRRRSLLKHSRVEIPRTKTVLPRRRVGLAIINHLSNVSLLLEHQFRVPFDVHSGGPIGGVEAGPFLILNRDNPFYAFHFGLHPKYL